MVDNIMIFSFLFGEGKRNCSYCKENIDGVGNDDLFCLLGILEFSFYLQST
jgi:hypothetical protein